MSVFPKDTPANSVAAVALLENALIKAGATPAANLDQFGVVASTVSNLLANAAPGFALSTSIPATKSVTGIADATPTDVLTVTIPNGVVNADIRVTLLASLGAGGAIGAGEASQTITYNISVTRTAGVNAVTNVSTAFGSAKNAVAGANTITATLGASSVAGAVGAVNTFTIQATITKGGGSSANHVAALRYEVFNLFDSGATLV